MVICSCNLICHKKVFQVVKTLRKRHPERPVTPGAVHKELDCQPDCGNCTRHLIETIADIMDEFEQKARSRQKTSCKKETGNAAQRRPNRLTYAI